MTEEERQRKSAERKKRWRGVMYGGGTPPVAHGVTTEWVPANAKIYIDLVNNRAWTQTSGEVAINTLLGSDPNTVNAWQETNYNSDNLTVDGYDTTVGDPPAFIGAALSKLVSGATVVSRHIQADLTPHAYAFALMSSDGNDSIEIFTAGGTSTYFNADSYGGSLSLQIPNIENLGERAINCLAITVTDSRFEFAANGSDAVAGELSADDRPPGNPMVASLIYGCTIQSITIYDALPSTTGLSALSAIT